MAEEKKKITFGNIGNALKSVATDHITTVAGDVFDEERQQYQGEINNIVGSYIENPEFFSVKIDAEGKLLWWIEKDGSVNWSKGVPKPIQVKLQELEQKIKDNADDDKTLAERVTDNETAIVAINEALDNYKAEVAEALSKKMDGEYIENPEFVHVYTDSEDKILWALLKNGKVLYGAGVPDQIMELVNEIYDTFGRYEDNPEFIHAHTDAEGKLLWWIEKDGTVGWSKGVPTPIQEELKRLEQLIKDNTEGGESVVARVAALEVAITKKVDGEYIENPEFIHVLTDSEGRILWGLLNNGKVMYGAGIPDQIAILIEEIYDTFGRYTDNPEFIEAKCDNAGRLIYGVLTDGDFKFGKMPSQITELVKELKEEINSLGEWVDNPEYARVITDSNDKIIDYTDKNGRRWIHDLHADNIPENLSEIEDVEDRISINTDRNDKILSYRDASGKLNECVGLKTPVVEAETVEAGSLNLSQVGLNEFEQALRNNGFRGGQGDWSEATSLHIPEPRCAMINITSADGKPYSWPTSKFVNNKVWVEFYDMQGNYFKKRAIHNAQGASSMGFIKKNGAFDFCNDEWIGDDTFSVKFGDWVYQDSFHVKAYYTDFFKGVSIVAYKIADQVEKSRGIFSDRPWKKGLLKDYVFGSDQANSAQINDMTLQLNNEAKCHPDGFPCIIYLDGAFYGIYTFCLKKHRDNYHMKKDVAEHIHLDGTLYVDSIWQGTVDWTQFEIRNPKNLYYKEAQKGSFEYDADVAQAEIAGDDEVNAWIAAGQLPDGTVITSKIKKRLQTTAKVKNYIIAISQALPQVKSATTLVDKKAIFERYFDVDNLVDYEIVQMATGDTDGFMKNWQWTTYDGVKWYVNEYDKDMSFGGHFSGTFTQHVPEQGDWAGKNSSIPTGMAFTLYPEEMAKRWKALYGNILSYDNFMALFNDWLDRIGTVNFKKEYEKWNEAPCNRDSCVDTVHWQRTDKLISSSLSDVTYDNSKTYSVGETCNFGFDYVFEFVCVSETTGNPPLTKQYDIFPKTMGYKDSIWRLSNYIKSRLEKENEFINKL